MRTIAIIGGGFAGSAVARTLVRRLPVGWEALLISEESYTTYNPMLPEVVGASVFPEHVVAPLREVVGIHRRGRFVMGLVTDVDFSRRSVTCDTLAGERSFGWEHLVLACGNRARLDLLPGMAEHAMPLKTVGDALHIRNVVLRRLARMELEDDPARRRRLGHFVIVGGGFSGVEVAGAIADATRGAMPYYPRVAMAEVSVTLVHGMACLLPELPMSLGEAAGRILLRRGVAVRLNAAVQAIGADHVLLGDGTRIETETVIGSIGTRSNPLLARLGVPLERGRVRVGPELRVEGHEHVWAMGDCAAVVNMRDGALSPTTAQFAVRQAALLGENLLASVAERPLRAFSYRPRGQMAAVGHRNGVAQVFFARFSGLPAWLVWRAYYLALMPTLGRRFRIFVEWSWGMLFATDITHIRFTRSVEHEPVAAAVPVVEKVAG